MIIKGDKKELIAPTQFYLDEDLSIPSAESIVSVMVSAKVGTVDAMNGEARISYKVCYKVLYKGQNGLDCLTESFDHQTTVKSPFITPKTYIDMDVQIVATEYVGIINLKVRSTVEIKGYAIIEVQIDTAELPDNLNKKTSKILVESIEPVRESEIVASQDFDVKEGVGTILTYDTQVIIKTVSAATEICEVSGECYTYITYLNEGNLLSRCFTIPFSTEILAPSVNSESSAYCVGVAQATTITLLNGSGSNQIKLEIVVGIRGFSVIRSEVDIVSDVYSKEKELKISRKSAYIEDNLCLTAANEKLAGSIRLDDDKKVRSVLCVCPPSVGAVNVNNNMGLSVEGVVSADIIYLDGEDNVAKVLAEIPYQFMLAKDFPCQGNLTARTTVTNLMARARHNDQIEISGEITIEVFGSSGKELAYIDAVEEIGEREQNDYAISLYIVHQGETLWDVAKALVSDEETLLKLNPDVKLPLKGGEKVLVYRELG